MIRMERYHFKINDSGGLTCATTAAIGISNLLNPIKPSTSAIVIGFAAAVDFGPYCAERIFERVKITVFDTYRYLRGHLKEQSIESGSNGT